MINLRPARKGDYEAIAALTTTAFEAFYPNGGAHEADIIAGVRAEDAVAVELVAEDHGEIVGHILFSRMTTEPAAHVVALGPVSVAPSRQREGIGADLCRGGLERARDLGAVAAVVLGHPAYYPRFGFSTDAAGHLSSPYAGSPAFMATALVPRGLDGLRAVAYPAAFG